MIEIDELEQKEATAAEAANCVVDALVTSLINARLYFGGHPRVMEAISDLRRELRAAGQLAGTGEVRLSVAERLIIFQERPLVGASLAASRLVDAVENWKAGGVLLSATATESTLLGLLSVLDEEPAEGEDYNFANQRLEQMNCEGVRLLAPFRPAPEAGGPDLDEEASILRVPIQLYQSLVDVLQNVTLNVWQGRRIPFEPVHEHTEVILNRLDKGGSGIMSLTGEEQYDAFTFGHSVKVTLLTLNFARALTTDRESLLRLGSAALLHDVGKSLVPMEILHSREALSDEERVELNRHPEYGAQILMDHREADSMSIAVAFGHHKTESNGGYPETRHDHRLSGATRILKICDTYEALTAARPYKRAMSTIRAYRVMMSMKDHFEPRLLHRFIEVNGVYPIGQEVVLSTGEHAQVMEQTRELLHPVVKVVRDRDGEALPADDQEVLNLASKALEQPPTIVGPAKEENAHPEL